MARLSTLIPAYLTMAIALLWPVGDGWVPGGMWTDSWNSQWAMWFAHEAVSHGELPWATSLLNHPTGGTVLLPDLLGAVFGALTVGLIGMPGSTTAWMVFQLAFAGLIAHRFALEWLMNGGLAERESHTAAWVAGIGHMTAPVLLAGATCGTTEAVAGGWSALAIWLTWRAFQHPTRTNHIMAGLGYFLAALAGWYTATIALVFGCVLTFLAVRKKGLRACIPVLGGLILVLPLAFVTLHVHSDPNHLATRAPEVYAYIRDGVGSSSIIGMFWPIDIANIADPNPAATPAGYLHTTYLGWTLLIGSCVALRHRSAGAAAMLLAGTVCAVLSWGPGDSGMLPYGLVEDLPGFRSLSLVWRLAGGAALAIAMATAAATRGTPRNVVITIVLLLIEVFAWSPVRGEMPHVNGTTLSAMTQLRSAPPGAVLTLPASQQKVDLWLQTQHHHPVTGGINQRRSAAAQTWVNNANTTPWPEVTHQAKEIDLRYIIVHQSERLRTSRDRVLAHRLQKHATRISRGERWAVYAVW
jgi:hypothetical protein